MYSLNSPFVKTVVITQEELDDYKAKQLKREVEVLEELIQGHRDSIAQLQTTITRITEEQPKDTKEQPPA